MARRLEPALEATRITVPLELVIRPARRADLPALEWYGMYEGQRELLERAMVRHERGDNYMLVADVEGFPVGQLWLDLAPFRAERAGDLWALRVFPWLRSRGIGTALIRHGERVLVALGVRTARIGAELDNPRARALYERLGYVVIGQRSDPYEYRTPDGRRIQTVAHQWILEKPLPRS